MKKLIHIIHINQKLNMYKFIHIKGNCVLIMYYINMILFLRIFNMGFLRITDCYNNFL